jgi:tRNA(Ile)-lysidine synthase
VVLENLKRPPNSGLKIYVGLSGGRDSVALLHLINNKILSSDKSSSWYGRKVQAIHVNHNLQIYSDKFEFICKEICQNLGVELEIVKLNIDNNSIRKLGLEAAARKQRFNAFQSLIKNQSDTLALGHHLDDQIETVFLQWMRGAGLEGLTGMLILDTKIIRDKILKVWRPLLDTKRSEISKYAEMHNLKWVDDPTNDDLEYDRNLIRHKVIPLLESTRIGAQSAMARSIQHLQSARLLLDEITSSALENCIIERVVKSALEINLSKHELLKLDDQLISRVLRAWLKKMGCSVPPTRRLREFIRQLRNSSKKTGSLIEVNGENGYRIISGLSELTLIIK